MVDLFVDRLEESLFFIYSVVDYFGFFYIKEGRREFKRYEVFFICMLLYVVYFEIVALFTTDVFLNCLSSFYWTSWCCEIVEVRLRNKFCRY